MTQEKLLYQSPEIEVIEISVEKGFATSNTPQDTENYNNQPW